MGSRNTFCANHVEAEERPRVEIGGRLVELLHEAHVVTKTEGGQGFVVEEESDTVLFCN